MRRPTSETGETTGADLTHASVDAELRHRIANLEASVHAYQQLTAKYRKQRDEARDETNSLREIAAAVARADYTSYARVRGADSIYCSLCQCFHAPFLAGCPVTQARMLLGKEGAA